MLAFARIPSAAWDVRRRPIQVAHRLLNGVAAQFRVQNRPRAVRKARCQIERALKMLPCRASLTPQSIPRGCF
jgi:hypothetical protein